VTAPKPLCRGCREKSDRDGLCLYCRSAAAELAPPKLFDPDASLKSLRDLMEEWVAGLSTAATDRLVAQLHILVRHLDDGGTPPTGWKHLRSPESKPPGPKPRNPGNLSKTP
jgi:hypothetical protein